MVSGRWSNAVSGAMSSLPVTAMVYNVEFAGDPAVWLGQTRTWTCPGIPTNAWVGFDPEVATTRTSSPTGSTFTLRMERAETYSVLARLGGTNAPVAAAARVHGFSQLSSTALDREVYAYADGSSMIITGLLLDSAEALPDDLVVHIDLSATGSTIMDPETGDMVTSIEIPVSLLNGSSFIPVVYLRSADSWAANCSSLYAVQDGTWVGDR